MLVDIDQDVRRKMNPEIKAKWVAALRSGKYKQGKAVLKDTEGRFCCLGVLCDIYNPDGWGEPVTVGVVYTGHSFGVEGDCSSTVLPDVVVKWANMPGSNPTVIVNECGDSISVAELNDQGDTFVDIADLIEENL